MKTSTNLFLALGLIVLLSGCTAEMVLEIQESPAGLLSVSWELDQAFLSYWDDLSSLSPDDFPPLDDSAVLLESFGQAPGVSQAWIGSNTQGRTVYNLRFPDLLALNGTPPESSATMNNSGAFDLTRQVRGGHEYWSLKIQPGIASILMGAGQASGNDAMELLFPPGAEWSPTELREMLIYMLEGYGPQPSRIIDQSSLSLTLRTPRPLISFNRGERISPRELRVTIPLLEVLSSREEQRIEWSF